MKEIDLTTTSWPVVNYNNKYELTTIIRNLAEESERNSEIIEESINELNREVEDIETAIGDMKSMVSIEYDDLVKLRNNSELVPGAWYRIIDYTTTTVQEETQSAGHDFDVIVLALDNKTLSEDAKAIHSERDTEGYFSESNLSAWKLRYCLDNDGNRFEWVNIINEGYVEFTGWFEDIQDNLVLYMGYKNSGIFADKSLTTLFDSSSFDSIYIEGDINDIDSYIEGMTWGGTYIRMNQTGREDVFPDINLTGVIYQMIDEYNNDLPYDFKNIQFKRDKSKFAGKPIYNSLRDGEVYYYTFDSNGNDAALQKLQVYKNKIGNYIYGNGIKLNDSIFIGNDFYYNTIGNNFYSNTIDYNFSYNTIGNSFNSNTIGDNFRYNTIGNDFNRNTIGYSFSYNTIGNNFDYNTIGDNFIYNTIGNNFDYNTTGYSFIYNTIGNSFHYNTIGDSFNSNTIGNNFDYNTIGDSFNSNTIGNNCYFLYSTDRDYLNNIKYLYIKDGTIGTSEPNKLRIDETGSGASNDTPRTILKTKTGKFIVEYYDDLDKKIAYKEVGTETNWTVNS